MWHPTRLVHIFASVGMTSIMISEPHVMVLCQCLLEVDNLCLLTTLIQLSSLNFSHFEGHEVVNFLWHYDVSSCYHTCRKYRGSRFCPPVEVQRLSRQDWSKRVLTRVPWQNLKQCEMNTEESYFSIRSLIPNCEPVSPLFLRESGELASSGPYFLNYLKPILGFNLHNF